jgi:hypothetical protein
MFVKSSVILKIKLEYKNIPKDSLFSFTKKFFEKNILWKFQHFYKI